MYLGLILVRLPRSSVSLPVVVLCQFATEGCWHQAFTVATHSISCDTLCVFFLMQGIGIEETLESIVRNIPAPSYTVGKPLRALIFDSKYDSYKVTTVGNTTVLPVVIISDIACPCPYSLQAHLLVLVKCTTMYTQFHSPPHPRARPPAISQPEQHFASIPLLATWVSNCISEKPKISTFLIYRERNDGSSRTQS